MMAERRAFEVMRIKHGWAIKQDELTLEAENSHLDRGVIRATFTVRNHTAIHFPAVRRTVLRALATMAEVDESLTTTQVVQGVQFSSATVRHALEDLQALGILTVTKGGQGKSDRWQIQQEWGTALETLKKVEAALLARQKATFPEMLEEGAHMQTSTASDDACPACGEQNWREIPGGDAVCQTCARQQKEAS
jgi:hypothetical protein